MWSTRINNILFETSPSPGLACVAHWGVGLKWCILNINRSSEFCATLTLVLVQCSHVQALTGTRYPTLPGFYFYYPYPTRKCFQNFRVQGSNYTCCFQSRIISMMPANQLRRKRNSLKIVKIYRNAEHEPTHIFNFKWPHSCSKDEEKNSLF